MLSPNQQLRVAVVGRQDLAGELDGTTGDAGQRIAATATTPEAFSPRETEADCLVVDGHADSWRAVLSESTDAAPELPVVVVIAEAFESAVESAIQLGADDYLPRSLSARRPSLLAARLVAAVGDATSRGVTPSNDPIPAHEADAAGQSQDDPADRPIDSSSRSLFEGVSDGLVVHDPETGEILDCNGRFCELTGYSRGELLGNTVDRVVAADEEYSYEQARERIRRTTEEGPQLFEWRGHTKSGESFPVEVHLDRVSFGEADRVLASVPTSPTVGSDSAA